MIAKDYWFKIEPYVHVSMTTNEVLMYNTLDGVFIETDKTEVVKLIKETLLKENCGVVLITSDRYQQSDINAFITDLRKKYMGDVIEVSLSKGKPVQILPYFNLLNVQDLFKKHCFSLGMKILKYLSEINIHINKSTNVTHLITYLKSIPLNIAINIIGNLEDVVNCKELLLFLDDFSSLKKIITTYINVVPVRLDFENKFSYLISVRFPVDRLQWDCSRKFLLNQKMPFEYVFEVSSSVDCLQATMLAEECNIEKYQLKPIYTGDNLTFFEEKVFLSKEDILSTPLSINDFFANQSMNIYDFGKIHIMPDGEIYTNLNHPALGNIQTHSIHDIISKELEEGKSWLRIRNQAPCNTCIYQWHCPSPSDYEIEMGRPNLCHVKL